MNKRASDSNDFDPQILRRSNGSIFKWISGVLVSFVLLTAGAALQATFSHEGRIASAESGLMSLKTDVTARLDRIEVKLDRVIERGHGQKTS